VVEDLDAESVAETLAFSASRFIQLTGKPDLRVALCALNPHAGEAGAFGDEERLLTEARDRAEAAFREAGAAGPYATLPSPFPPDPAPTGWALHPGAPASPGHATGPHSPTFSGPLPSDSLFHRAVSGEFDLVVALYHDQGLIPIKLLEPSRAVNLTLGLPFIRTSPDHGTAFDKAGKWIADPRNFLEAAALAVRLAGRARREPWTAQVAEP
jgi:4-hydroxythreonine-4-phosphate dehydrogenase